MWNFCFQFACLAPANVRSLLLPLAGSTCAPASFDGSTVANLPSLGAATSFFFFFGAYCSFSACAFAASTSAFGSFFFSSLFSSFVSSFFLFFFCGSCAYVRACWLSSPFRLFPDVPCSTFCAFLLAGFLGSSSASSTSSLSSLNNKYAKQPQAQLNKERETVQEEANLPVEEEAEENGDEDNNDDDDDDYSSV